MVDVWPVILEYYDLLEAIRWCTVSKKFHSLIYSSVGCIDSFLYRHYSHFLLFSSITKNDYLGDDFMKQFKNLTSLNLQFPRIRTSISDECLNQMITLKTLDLSGNQWITDKGVQSLTNLEELDISVGSVVGDLGIKNLINLRIIHLWSNEYVTNSGLKLLTNLTELDLMKNEFITYEGIEGLTKLKELNIDENETITTDCIKKLSNLRISAYENFNIKLNTNDIDEFKSRNVIFVGLNTSNYY